MGAGGEGGDEGVVGRREREVGKEEKEKEEEEEREREREGGREINQLLDTGSLGLFISLDSISISSYQVY